MKVFEVNHIALKGKNVVEASAGTGKTHAIAMLVLRLILEEKAKVEQILIVTFTKAAVAELEIRVRKILRNSLEMVSKNEFLQDQTWNNILQSSIKTKGSDNTHKLLTEAILFLDETSIFTIHSFCQTVLSDYAFENGLLLNTNIIEDQSNIIEDAAKEYWRMNITILPKDILNILILKEFNVDRIIEAYRIFEEGSSLRIKNKPGSEVDICSNISKYESEILKLYQFLLAEITNDWQQIKDFKIDGRTKLARLRKENNVTGFTDTIIELASSTDKRNELLEKYNLIGDDYNNLKSNFEEYKIDIVSDYLSSALINIDNFVKTKKKRNKVISFFDLIKILYENVVVRNNSDVIKNLNKKYRAVFIDEFQDTDYLQYSIFKRVFVENSPAILFFIGDPKQSIYSWRGADIDTYESAKKDLKDSLFTMNTNFRSTPQMIQAVNDFYAFSSSFDSLQYQSIYSGNDKLGTLKYASGSASAIDIVHDDDNKSKTESYLDYLAAEVIQILSNNTIDDESGSRKVKPQDIGILVRTNQHARDIKQKLNEFKIPSLIVDDTKVITTSEAKDLHEILTAVLEPKTDHISRAMLTSFMDYDIDQIQKLDFDNLKIQFINIYEEWKSNGVYSAIIRYIDVFNVRSILVNSDNPRGERIYTNLLHLADILNQKEIRGALTPLRLLDWFQRARQGDKSVQKYEQQLETDQNSLQIVTVHKSKGLQYNIVILPKMNLRGSASKHFYTQYKSNGHKFFSIYHDEEEKAASELQSIYENERLLYVAITRAVFKCIIFYDGKNGILKPYIDRLDRNSISINFKTPQIPEKQFRYRFSGIDMKSLHTLDFNGKIDNSWKVTSYTGLSPHGELTSVKEIDNFVPSDNYDKFIFSDLAKGAKTGLIIHEILEKINFNDDKYHESILRNVLSKYEIKEDQINNVNFKSLINNIIKTNLFPYNFKLDQIINDHRISELEFYFSFPKFKTKELCRLIPGLTLNNIDIQGVMHGFVDLIFYYQGKYYILDWKTNHLGYDNSDYDIDSLSEAVIRNTYNLQYYIYTIALVRYLRSKNSNFDYNRDFGGIFYLFIRGMRENSVRGIFYDLPEENRVMEIDSLLGKT